MARDTSGIALPSKKPTLAILIPAFNEGQRLPATLQGLSAAISKGAFGGLNVTQVIIADDGSTDRTVEVANQMGQKLPGFSVETFDHAGKGGAIQSGWMRTKTDWVLIADADLVVTWFSAAQMAEVLLDRSIPIAIGARGETHSTLLLRRTTGRLFNWLVRRVLGISFQDTQCGFKLFHRATAHPIFLRLTSLGFAWDVELLFLAQRAGLKVHSHPIDWEDRPGSKVNVLLDGAKMFLEIIRIRWRQRGHRYP